MVLLAAAMAEAQEITRPVTSGQPPFVSVEPASTDALRFEGHLPGFEAKDTNGKVWRSADLLGKLTVVDIWGSRGPNEEHKELQRFCSDRGLGTDKKIVWQARQSIPELEVAGLGTRPNARTGSEALALSSTMGNQ